MADESVKRRLAAILAADVVSYSRLMGEDEEATLATLKSYRGVIDELVLGHDGRVFGSAGDSVIAEFLSPVEAVRCAVEVQQVLSTRNADLVENRRMLFRIGINVGDVMVEGDNLFGEGVNVAARLEGMARPGGLCVSDNVVNHVRERLGLEFEDLGQHEVKNIAHPIRVYRVPLASEFLETSPFRGLDVFEYEHADIFHGRARAIEVTRDRLQKQADAGSAFLLIYGMSGSGKSSLMRAGLLPAIIRSGTVSGVRRFCVFRPSEGSNPRTALAQAILSETALPEFARTSDGVANVAGLFEGNADEAVAAVDAAIKLATKDEAVQSTRVVVAVDQLEELFTSEHIDADERAAFIALLTVLARSGLIWVVATVRTDFLQRCAGVPGLSELKDGLGSYELLPPTGPEIAQMIRNPARTAGLRFEEDPTEGRLEDMLQQAAASDPTSLPLLEFVLDALYEAGRDRLILTFADYRSLGGLEGAIARRADDVVVALSDEIQDALPSVLRSLITMRLRDEAVTARPALRAEITSTRAQVALVNALTGARLLVSDESGGEAVVRVAHEALLSHWPRAQQVIAGDREFLETRARVQADTRRWLAEDKNPDLLLPSGKRLAEAEDLLSARRGEVEDQTAEYVEASVSAQRAREEAEREAERQRLELEAAAAREREAAARDREAGARRMARRTRIAAVITLILAVATGLGAVVGFRGQQEASRQAEVAEENAIRARAAEQEAERQAQAALKARDRALRNQSIYLTDLSRQETASGDAMNGMLLALEALPRNMSERDRPYVVEAETALYQAVFANREIAVLRNHEGTVRHVAFSPDGSRLVSTSADKTARIWDAISGAEIAILTGHEGPVSHAAFSPDGTRVITGSWDRTARLWDVATGSEITVLRGHGGQVLHTAFSPDGSHMLTASPDGTARVWDAAGGTLVAILRHEGAVRSGAFNPSGTRVVTTSGDWTARVWDATSGTEIVALRGHRGGVHDAAFSPDGTRVVTGSWDRTARLWDATSGAEIAVLRHDDAVSHAAFSPDGNLVVTSTFSGAAHTWDAISGAEVGVVRAREQFTRKRFHSVSFSHDSSRILIALRSVRLWDATSGTEIAILYGHESDVIHAAFSPDGERIVTASLDGTVRLWKATGSAESAGVTILRGHEHQVGHAAFSPNGSRVVTASSDSTARVWDTATGAVIAVLRGHEGEVVRAEFSPDGSRVATASLDRTARLWDAATGIEIAVLSGHGKAVWRAAFSPDGSHMVTASSDGTAHLWDVSTGVEIAVLRGHEDAIRDAVFSPDGKFIVTASNDRTARLWDATTGLDIVALEGHEREVLNIAFSPTASSVLTASADHTARVWDASSGTEITVLRGHKASVQHATFSPDGSRIVTASLDKTARVWDVASGSELAILRGHEASVTGAEFSPSGAHIVTASRDNTARLWDAATGTEIVTLPGSRERDVRHAAFSPDGSRIVTASADNTAMIYSVFPTTQDLIDHAKSIVRRELTPCERKRFFLSVEDEVGDCPN